MNCAVERHNCGTVKMKTLNYVKNSYQKEQNFDQIVDHLCNRLQDIKDSDRSGDVGMRMRYEETEAVRRYCAAFPALKKGEGLPSYCQPPPSWCRRDSMQPDLSKDYATKTKKFQSNRRNTHPRKGSKKRNGYSKTLKENLPEWAMPGEVWAPGELWTPGDAWVPGDTWAPGGPDPVREFLRAAGGLDEGYGTADTARIDDLKPPRAPPPRSPPPRAPPPRSPPPRAPSPLDEEMYAKFEAKFDRSLEALWAARASPLDECQELPIDFHDLLSSPSDNMFMDPAAEKCSMISLEKTPPVETSDLHTRLRPLRLDEPEPFSLYSYEGIYEALPSVADIMRSLTTLNHSKQSSFTEVFPRPRGSSTLAAPPAPAPAPPLVPSVADPRDDLLTSERTHFRPIRKESETEPLPQHKDGDTFDIRGDLDPVEYSRSPGGGLYVAGEGEPRRYFEYRTRSIDYSRLNLTAALRLEHEFEDERGLKLKFPLEHTSVGVQTDLAPSPRAAWGACDQCGGRNAKLPRSDLPSIWSSDWECGACAGGVESGGVKITGGGGELEQEWEELLADISAVTGGEGSGGGEGERKRRRRGGRCRPHASCSHPHAPFLHCLGSHRPLTR